MTSAQLHFALSSGYDGESIEFGSKGSSIHFEESDRFGDFCLWCGPAGFVSLWPPLCNDFGCSQVWNVVMKLSKSESWASTLCQKKMNCSLQGWEHPLVVGFKCLEALFIGEENGRVHLTFVCYHEEPDWAQIHSLSFSSGAHELRILMRSRPETVKSLLTCSEHVSAHLSAVNICRHTCLPWKTSKSSTLVLHLRTNVKCTFLYFWSTAVSVAFTKWYHRDYVFTTLTKQTTRPRSFVWKRWKWYRARTDMDPTRRYISFLILSSLLLKWTFLQQIIC